jgi:ketosteroid isomerase-like protein
MLMTLNTHLINAAPRRLVGRVTSLTNALQQVVTSLSIAGLATILTARATAHLSAARAALAARHARPAGAPSHDVVVRLAHELHGHASTQSGWRGASRERASPRPTAHTGRRWSRRLPPGVADRKDQAMTLSKDPHPIAVVERFLRAMSRRDVDAMFAELAPDVLCAFPTAPGGPQEIRSWETNRTFYSTVIRPMTPTFSITRMELHALADDPERVVVEYASDGSLVDGSPYQNRYLALGTVRDGLIQRWTEYCDPAPIERALAALHAAHAVVGGNTMASAAQVVNEYLAAFWSGDFDKARSLVADDFSFRGPLAQADNKETFFASAAPLAPIVRGYRLVRQWEEGDEVCTVYECKLETPVGTGSVPISEWNTVRSGRVAAARLMFDTAAFRALMPSS